jgi:hypothetical protein
MIDQHSGVGKDTERRSVDAIEVRTMGSFAR